MKGLALEIVVALIIATASLAIFLLLVTGNFQPFSRWLYCNVIAKISTTFSGTGLPQECMNLEVQAEKHEIEESNNLKFSRILLGYIIACWKKSDVLRPKSSFVCYELHLKNEVEDVVEANVSKVLNEEDFCTSIENSDYGCGVYNQILWRVDGQVKSLSKTDLEDALENAFSQPTSISLQAGFEGGSKADLQYYLTEILPNEICEKLSCKNWYYNESLNQVFFKIDETKVYYDVDLIFSYLEKNGKIYSPINQQKILLINYNFYKDAVEVIG